MKILVLEDDIRRIEIFEFYFKKLDLKVTSSSKEAVDLVNKIKYDVIFLDHDLGVDPNTGNKVNQVYLKSGEYTGYEAAQAIATSINKETPVVIHSYNQVGAKAMGDVLVKSVYYPFGVQKFDAVINSILKQAG